MRAWPTLVLPLLMAMGATAGAADFDPRSSDWNGLAELVALADSGPLTLTAESSLPDTSQGLLWIHVGDGVDHEALRRFIQAGGRAVIAQDSGESSALFSAFGVTLGPVDTGPMERLGGNPALPVARPAAGWPLGQGVGQVVANHPAGLTGDGERRLVFPGSDSALAIERQVGGGRILFLSDPSVLINNMLELDGNRRFARNLLTWLSGRGGGVRLFVGLPPGGGGPPGFGLGEFLGLEGLRDHLPWLVLVAFGLAVIGLAFLVPAGGERAWGGRDPIPEPERPSHGAVRIAALAALPDDADGRVLAAMAGQRARSVLRGHGIDLSQAYDRLAGRAADLPRGLSGLAALLQQVEETPPVGDPYAPDGRSWTMAEALALDLDVQELEKGMMVGGAHAA